MTEYSRIAVKRLACTVLTLAIEDYRTSYMKHGKRWRTAYRLLHGLAKGPSGYTCMLEFCCELADIDPATIQERVIGGKQ